MDTNLENKLRKLLALAKDSRGNEHEAAAAMAKVQQLLAEQNLTIADLEARGESGGEGAARAKERVSKCAMYEYQRELMKAVAEAHYCIYWTVAYTHYKEGSCRGTKRYAHMLIGRESNVMSARMMFDYLNTTIERLSGEEYPHPMNLSNSAISWKQGAAGRLGVRLAARRAELDAAQEEAAKVAQATAAASGATANALVLVSGIRSTEADLNRDFRYGYAPGTTAAERAKSAANWDKHEAEMEAMRVAAEAAEEDRRSKLTPAQREREDAKRAAEQLKADRDAQRYWDRLYAQQQAKLNRRDHSAFRAGSSRGNDIGLDSQIDKHANKQIGG